MPSPREEWRLGSTDPNSLHIYIYINVIGTTEDHSQDNAIKMC